VRTCWRLQAHTSGRCWVVPLGAGDGGRPRHASWQRPPTATRSTASDSRPLATHLNRRLATQMTTQLDTHVDTHVAILLDTLGQTVGHTVGHTVDHTLGHTVGHRSRNSGVELSAVGPTVAKFVKIGLIFLRPQSQSYGPTVTVLALGPKTASSQASGPSCRSDCGQMSTFMASLPTRVLNFFRLSLRCMVQMLPRNHTVLILGLKKGLRPASEPRCRSDCGQLPTLVTAVFT